MSRLTYYGHSCFAVELTDGTRLLFDPFIRPNSLAADIKLEDIKADYILITHGHEDHLADAEELLNQTGATLISNFEIVTWFAEKGQKNGHPLNHGGGFNFPFGRVKLVNAVHSSTLPDGSNGGNPGGFVVEAADCSFYVSGDTALHYDQKLLGEFHQLDFAALCIGDNFTMGPADAAVAAQWAGVRKAVGLHYDTFPPIAIDKPTAVEAFAKREVDLLLPAIGETIGL